MRAEFWNAALAHASSPAHARDAHAEELRRFGLSGGLRGYRPGGTLPNVLVRPVLQRRQLVCDHRAHGVGEVSSLKVRRHDERERVRSVEGDVPRLHAGHRARAESIAPVQHNGLAVLDEGDNRLAKTAVAAIPKAR
jgi:hypothetical protein